MTLPTWSGWVFDGAVRVACFHHIPLVQFYRAFLPVRTPIRHGIGVLTYNILKRLLAKVAFLYALIQMGVLFTR